MIESTWRTLVYIVMYMWKYDEEDHTPRAPRNGSWSLYGIRFFVAGFFWIPLFLQYMLLYWIDRHWNYSRWWFFWLIVPFMIQNLLFNLIVGSFLFWERPRFLQFTSRVQMLYDRADPRVCMIVMMLNEHDEHHIEL